MSLLFMDGFDDGLTSLKWTTLGVSTEAGGRTGNRLKFTDEDQGAFKQVQPADEHATFVIGFAFQHTTILPPTRAFLFLESDNGATTHLSVGVDSSRALYVLRGGTTLGTSAIEVVDWDAWNYVEVKAVLHDSTGSVIVRVDGVAVLTLTGIDTKNAGTKTVFDSVTFLGTVAETTTPTFYLDDFYLCNGAGSANNDFLGDCSVETLYPNGNGNSSQMVGSDGNSVDNYLLVDEAVPSSADYVASGVDGAKDTYAFGNLVHTTGSVKGVQVAAYAAKSDTGTRTMSNVIRSAGADTVYPVQALSTAYTALRDIVEQDPNGPVNWSIASVNAAEFGVQVGTP